MEAEDREGPEAEASAQEVRLECEFHAGPLHLREGAPGFWACPGFDGEGCSQLRASGGVPIDAAERLIAEATYWPGINVNGKSWQRISEELRQRRKERRERRD